MNCPGIFRYVRWQQLADYERCGWMAVANLGPYHGQHGVLCEWKCNCPCIEPRQSEIIYPSPRTI
jgi:hypothetical protein